MSQNDWATIMPFGPVTNFLLAQRLALISGTDLIQLFNGNHEHEKISKPFSIFIVLILHHIFNINMMQQILIYTFMSNNITHKTLID
jgi:hypothetical protein